MLRVDVPIPKRADRERVIGLIESLSANKGLERRVKRSSRTYPGSLHWHYGRQGSPGTVEVTFWPSESKLWLSVHENRKGSWTRQSVKDLVREIKTEFTSDK